MNIIEIPVIGSRKSEKETIFTLLGETPLRKFEGMNVGFLKLDDDHAIYFYFLNQENEEYFYLWDLILPHAAGCLVICEMSNTNIFEKNVETIEYLKKHYATPVHICSLPVEGEEPSILKLDFDKDEEQQRFLYLDPQDKNSAKSILLQILTPGPAA